MVPGRRLQLCCVVGISVGLHLEKCNCFTLSGAGSWTLTLLRRHLGLPSTWTPLQGLRVRYLLHTQPCILLYHPTALLLLGDVPLLLGIPVPFPWDPASVETLTLGQPPDGSPEGPRVLPAAAAPPRTLPASSQLAAPSLSHSPPEALNSSHLPLLSLTSLKLIILPAIPLSLLNSNFLLSLGANQQRVMVKW